MPATTIRCCRRWRLAKHHLAPAPGGAGTQRGADGRGFALTPVNGAAVVTSPSGRKLGYVVVKDMISQALTPLDMAFANFKSAGVQDVVLDLRYNGGGLVSTGATVASYVAGSRGAGRTYAKLLYNDKRAAANNQSYAFSTPAGRSGLRRVIVLMGPAHLLGQRAGHQWPAGCRHRGTGGGRHHLRQAGGLPAHERLRPDLQRGQLRERQRAQRGPLLRRPGPNLPGGGRLQGRDGQRGRPATGCCDASGRPGRLPQRFAPSRCRW
jgi:hypothetical protein